MRFLHVPCVFIVFAACTLATVVCAAPAERDLGNGLVYYRVRQLPGDLPPKPAGAPAPCVVDVRYLKADSAAATAFVAWAKFRATSRSPVFIVANGETSPALVQPFTTQPRGGGIAVVGIAARNFTPHVAVTSTAEKERAAYDALEKGASLVALLTDNPNKVRNDEASLSKPLPDALPDPAEDAVPGKQAAPPVDAALQRAVHLHRALVALRKI